MAIAELIIPELIIPIPNGLISKQKPIWEPGDLLEVVVDWRPGLEGQFTIAKSVGFFNAHPLGEGNRDTRRILYMRYDELVALGLTQIIYDEKLDTNKIVRVKRFDPTCVEVASKVVRQGIDNVYNLKSILLEDTNQEAYRIAMMALDTHENANHQAGTAKTHATLTNMVAAANSGDSGQGFPTAANTYSENVDYGAKRIHLSGTVANQGLTIDAPGVTCIDMSDAACEGSSFSNFRVEGTVGDNVIYMSTNCTVSNAIATGGNIGVRGTSNSIVHNVLSYANVYGFLNGTMMVQCTAAKNTTAGFQTCTSVGCISTNVDAGGTDYVTYDADSNLNWSEDATATGSGDQTGFDTAWFESWAGDNYDIAVAQKDNVRVFGVPMVPTDHKYAARKYNGDPNYLTPGWHEPDPIVGDIPPTVPVLVSVVPGDSKLTITFTGESGKDYYSRVWEPNNGLSVESETFKVAGNGTTPVAINHTGLINRKPYMIVIYGKDGTTCSDIVMDGIDYVPDTTTSLTYEKIGNIVRSRVKTQIETGQGVAVLYDNQDEASFTKPTDGSPWIRAAILPGEATQSTFGGSINRFRKLGVLHISVYNPIEEGDKVNRELADAVVDAFRNVSASGVVFKTPSLRAAMRDGMWWRQTITCPYYADDFGG